MFDSLPDTAEHVSLIFEQEGKNSVGKKVIMDTNKQSKFLPVFTVNFFDPSARSWNLFANPSMVVISRDGTVLEKVDGWGIPDDRRRFTNILKSYVGKLLGNTNIPQFSTLPISTTTAYTVPEKIHLNSTTTEKMYPLKKDEVFMGDLEKAVEYSLMKEVGMQPVLDQPKLKSLLYYTQALNKFFPNMRKPVKNFLTHLRDWIIEKQHSKVRSTQYNKKVKDLSDLYQPFAATPSNWKGCAGSQKKFRGYPCSLWTLFHTLTVNAADKDLAFHNDGVSTIANAMIGYITDFFSCRDCAEHFTSHVSQLGSLPDQADQSILWLWTIHNMANLMLAGDETEDPTHPKIEWPSEGNCPTCRYSNDTLVDLVEINGESWNKQEVINYIRKVYMEENIIKNVKSDIDTENVEGGSDVKNETRSTQTIPSPSLNTASDSKLESFVLDVIIVCSVWKLI